MSFVPFKPSGHPFGTQVGDAKATRPLPTTILEGKYCRVRPLNIETDGALLYPLLHGSEEKERVWDYMFYGPFPTLAHYLDYLNSRTPGSTSDVCYIVESKESGLPVGSISYMAIETTHRSIEIGSIYYATSVQRTPINTEATYLTLKHAFEDLNFRRMEWKANSLNEKSRKTAARMGFTFEGIFRSHRISKGRNRDTIWFSIILEEWPSIKANFEQWLYNNPDWKLSLAALNGNKYAGPAPYLNAEEEKRNAHLNPCEVSSVDSSTKSASLVL